MEDINEFILDFVTSLTDEQCNAAIKILKPLGRKMREEPALAAQLLEAVERELIAEHQKAPFVPE